jgi:hypothetical protein
MEGGGAEVSWEYFREVRQVFLGPGFLGLGSCIVFASALVLVLSFLY